MGFQLESDLCEAFKPEGFRRGWTLFGESHSWDMMFVDAEDRRLGIQAKLRDPAEAVAQCVEGMNKGLADAAAILVPYAGNSIRRLCQAQNIGIITPAGDPDEDGVQRFYVKLPTYPQESGTTCEKPLPSKPRNIPCGVKSPIGDFGPRQAMECILEHLLNKNGGRLTAKKCKSVGFDPRRGWMPDWLYKAEGWDRYEAVYGKRLPSEKYGDDFTDTVEEYESRTVARR